VADLSTGRARVLLTGAQARYVAPGYLVFNAGEERLRAVRFDLDRLEVHGAEVPAVEGVFRGPGGGAAAFAISQTGTLVYLAGGFERSLWLVDRDGREERIGVEPRGYRWPRVAPNGRRIVAAVDPRPSDIWIVDLEREVAQPLTTEGHHVNPAWAPDSERIVFSLDGDLHEMALRSGGAPRRISDRPGAQYMPSWSVNDVVMVNEPNPESAYDLVVIEVADGSARPFVATPANEVVPAFSPDGRWVTYASDASGRYEVYVTAFPGPGPRYTVSAGGGNEPKWASSGDEIIYRGADRMWAVAVTTSPEFSVGAPRALFEPARYDFSQANNWDLAPDGRFVMVKSDPSMRRQLELVQNFPEELERRLSN
jgi:Tol biopolymer transport system component